MPRLKKLRRLTGAASGVSFASHCVDSVGSRGTRQGLEKDLALR